MCVETIDHVVTSRVSLFISALSKSWKTLENEEGYNKCMEIIEEAKERVNEMVRMGTG